MIPFLPNPILGYIAIAAVLLSALGGCWLGHSYASAKGNAALSALSEHYADALREAESEAREKEKTLRTDIDTIQGKYQLLEEQAEREKLEDDRLIADLRSGTRRLSIAVKRCGSDPGDSATAAGSGTDPQRADIDPEAAGSLIGIARDGDKYIRERNACHEAYNAVRLRLNADKE